MMDGARRGLEHAEDHVDGRGLAGAVGTEETDDLALADGERNGIDGNGPGVVLPQIADSKHLHAAPIIALCSCQKSTHGE